MGYGSTFERDFLLDLERGIVKNTRVRHNGKAESATVTEGYEVGAMTVFPRASKSSAEVQ